MEPINLNSVLNTLNTAITFLDERITDLESKVDRFCGMDRLQIQKVKHDEACEKDLYNVCNLWEKRPPIDYNQKLEATWTRHWIDLFHKDYQTVIIKGMDVHWIQEAFKIGTITAKFPNTFVDEFSELRQKLDNDFPIKYEKAFVRAEATSLKGNIIYGAGPFSNWRQILEAMCTCRFTHHPFSDEVKEKKEMKLYLLPWLDNLKQDLEFRAFVFKNKLTGISPQNIYRSNYRLIEDIENHNAFKVKMVIKFLEEKVIPVLTNSTSVLDHTYTIDVALLEDSYKCTYEPYFIEINGFGAEYSAGSALFHWVRDKELLENGDKVTVRYVVK